MRRILAIFVTLSWALWFGGIIALFLFVSTLFRQSRGIAVEAAPMLFHAFERYQLLVAALALVCLVLWRVLAASRAIMVVFALMALAAVMAVLTTTLVTPRMEVLRRQGQSSSPAFRQLHGRSMMFYTAEATLLLLAGIALPTAIAGTPVTPEPASTTPETVPDTAAV